MPAKAITTRREFARKAAALGLAGCVSPMLAEPALAGAGQLGSSAGFTAYLGRTEGFGIARVQSTTVAQAAAHPIPHTFADIAFTPPAIAYQPIDSPSWLCLNANGRTLYSVSETAGPEAALCAFSVGRDGALRLRARQPTDGAAPCHITLHASGRTAIVANYSGGSLSVFALADDGAITSEPTIWRSPFAGSGVVPDRQGAPHVHSSVYSPDGRTLVAADLGSDHLLLFRCDEAGRPVQALQPVALPPGSGPRHLLWNRRASVLYCICELSCRVEVFDVQATDAWPALRLRATGSVSTVSAGTSLDGAAAAALVEAAGMVCASTRGAEQIAVFRPAQDGALNPFTYLPSPVRKPRFMSGDSFGASLLVCGEDSGTAALVDLGSTRNGFGKGRIVITDAPKLSCLSALIAGVEKG